MRVHFPRPSRLSRPLLACTLLIICGGILTTAAYCFVQQRVTIRTNHTYETLTNGYATRLSQHMERYGDILYATRALFAAADVDAQAWKQFINSQNASERYAGMKSVAYARIVPAAQVEAYESMLQATQNQAITVQPRKTTGDAIILTYHVQPGQDGLQQVKALGFDLASEPVRMRTIQQATRTGHIATTAPIQLVTDKHPGFLLILPLAGEKANPSGPVYGYGIAAFDIEVMISKILGNELQKDHSSITITDISGDKPTELYAKTYNTWTRTVTRTLLIDVADRQWQLVVRTPTSSIVMLGDRVAPTAILVIGISFMALSCGLAYVLKTRQKII
jgi:CHASE1-domain containing sensor protein